MNESHNPYAPPSTDEVGAASAAAGAADVDQLLTQTQRSPMVKAAAGTTAASGVILLMTGLQLFGFRLAGLVKLMPFVMFGVGVLNVGLGLKIFRQRPWAAVTAAVCCSVVAVGSAGWLLISLSSGFVSVAALFAPLAAVVAAVFSALSVSACRRAARARAQLRVAGLDVDF